MPGTKKIMSENEHCIKCPICWGEKLGELSDIKDNEERFEKLNEFMQNTIEYDINEAEKSLIGEFRTIRDKVLLQMRERYGYTAKGNEYLENLFKEQFKKWEDANEPR